MARRILLISNSTVHGRGYLDHCEDEIREVLGQRRRILFVPYALHDQDEYARQARVRFARMGLDLESVHGVEDPLRSIEEAESVFVGGGNTFRLLNLLHRRSLVGALRERVGSGMPYIGSSAGSNVACVTIETTNDMPIIQPPSFEALDLVPFNINPHYIDPDPDSGHMGETREERIVQFLEEQDRWVVGLREGSFLRVEGEEIMLGGSTPARIFSRGRPPQEFASGARLDFLLTGPS